jgi:hypothetical protein
MPDEFILELLNPGITTVRTTPAGALVVVRR